MFGSVTIDVLVLMVALVLVTLRLLGSPMVLFVDAVVFKVAFKELMIAL